MKYSLAQCCHKQWWGMQPNHWQQGVPSVTMQHQSHRATRLVQAHSTMFYSHFAMISTYCCTVNIAKHKLAPSSGPQCSFPPLSLKYNTVFDSSSQISPISWTNSTSKPIMWNLHKKKQNIYNVIRYCQHKDLGNTLNLVVWWSASKAVN